MDNLAHTLAGIAIADAGLKRKTAFATTTLAIAANLPDIDVLIYLVGDGVDALAFRRGWTHGVLAMIVLPLVLTGLVLAWSRLRAPRSTAPPLDARWLLILSAIGVWSHPLLDLLNTYGVRLLMPFSGRWFYGDALFIIDVWMWSALLLGIIVARWRHTPVPAQIAIAALGVYIAGMAVSSRWGRTVVERQATNGRASRVMVSPVPVTPFERRVVRDVGSAYETGALSLGTRARYNADTEVPTGRETLAASLAAETEDGIKFLSWSRFPRFIVEADGPEPVVRISDMRYADERGRGWASVVIRIPAESASKFKAENGYGG